MDKIKRLAIISDLRRFLSIIDSGMGSEVVFKKIMPTNRLFRADFYLPKYKTIIEVNGGQFVFGRHNRGGKGYENDLTKLNLAQKHGFKIYQFTYEMLERNEHKTLFNE